MESELKNSVPTSLSIFLFRSSIQFSGDSIRAFKDEIKIRETRGLRTVYCTVLVSDFPSNKTT